MAIVTSVDTAAVMAPLAAIRVDHPDFEILHADLLDPAKLKSIGLADDTARAAALRSLQRVLRIDPDETIAATLSVAGMDSAHRIAAVGRSQFIQRFAAALGSADKARQIYDKATLIKSRVAHLTASLHGVMGSRYARALAGSNVGDDLTGYFQTLSSYQTLFGSLDYCDPGNGESILDPAAYLVDLLRIIDLAITVPNTTRPDAATVKAARAKYDQGTKLSDDEKRLLFAQNIPPGLRLDERRPDLGNIPLTGANTFNEEPYLEIVNAILTQTVAKALTKAGALQQNNVFLTLANLYYPFVLPYQLPLDRIRTALAAKQSSLAEVYGVALPSAALALGTAAEQIGLSAEQVSNLAPIGTGNLAGRVSANYGLTISDGNLAGMDDLGKFITQTGLAITDVAPLFLQELSAREIFDATGQYQTTGHSTTLTLVQQGDDVAGTFDSGGTLECVLHGLVMSGYWQQTSGGPTQAGSCQFTFSADGTSFQGQWRVGYTGAWSTTPWNGTRASATVGIIPHSFFINKTLAARQYLHSVDPQSSSDPTKIAFQSVGTLDTVNRFVRLAAVLGWSYPDLDWALTTLTAPTVDGSGNITCAAELDGPTLIELAKVKRLIDDYGFSVDDATCMWFDLRTIRCGAALESAAPFDKIFNNPVILSQFPNRTIYRPQIATGPSSYPNPLYTAQSIPWTIDGTGSDNAVAAAIVQCIPADADDIAAIATAAFPAGTFDLTVPNLSLLYRHARLAKQLNLRAPVYLALLSLLGVQQNGRIPATLDRDQILSVLNGAAWINACGISIPNLAYAIAADPAPLLAGALGQYVSPGYDPSAVPALLATVGQLLGSSLATPASLAPPGFATEAAAYYQVLLNTGYVDPVGVILKDAATAPPDFSKVSAYDPTVAPPTPAQLAYIVQALTLQANRQLQQVAGQLATFFGAKPDTLGVMLTDAAAWLLLESPVEPFVLTPLFKIAAADVETGGLPDPIKIATAFKNNKIPLSGEVTVTPQTATSWSLVDASSVAYTAVSPDLQDISYYKGSQLLFSGSLTSVLSGGAIDPTLVVSVFKANGITLAAPVAVTMTVAPMSWSIFDIDNNVTYYATQYGQPAAQMTFLGAAGSAPAGTAPAPAMIHLVSQLLIVAGAIPLSNTALATLGRAPAAFGFTVVAGQPIAMSLAGIHGVYQFSQLVSALADNKDGLAGYLVAVKVAATPLAADQLLCAITGWDVEQCTFVRTQLYGTQAFIDTVSRIAAVHKVFALAATFGIDVYLLWDVAGTAQLAATPTNYATFDRVASRLLQALRTRTPPEAWPTVYQQVNGPLLEDQRNALVPLAVWQLGQVYSDITTPRALSEFLLTDVETSGCAQLSVIKEALNAAQLYLQRCRLNLERNVIISTDDLPNIWWEWLLNYRIWQANREIFLYPENYLDPSLRQSKTQLFQTLESDLLQGDVTTERVEAEFRKYMDGLAQLAKLKIVDSCHAVVHDPDKGEVDTLFLIARTNTQPYKFYYIQRQQVGNCAGSSGQVWTEWLPIGITINSDTVTSVYAFNKLLIFWVEPTKKQQLDGSSDTSKRVTATTASVRYSYRNFAGNWMQPQTLVADDPINVKGPTTNLYGPFSILFGNTPAAMWGKVACLHIPPSAFAQGIAGAERLCVFFGPLLDLATGTADAPPDPNLYAGNTDVQDFVATIGQAYAVRNQLRGLKQPGKASLLDMVVLDSMLEPVPLVAENQYLILRGDTLAGTSAPSFQLGLNGSSLVAESAGNSLFNNYVAGTGWTIPYLAPVNTTPVTAQSFVGDYVTLAQATTYFGVLTSPVNQLIDPKTGLVSNIATTIPPAMLAQTLGVDIGTARWLREVMLSSYFGTPVLMSQVAAGSAALMPVNNQPGAFILVNGGEAFLITAATPAGAGFEKIDEAVAVGNTVAAVTPAVLVTRDIGPDQARQFYQALTGVNGLIDANGVVNTAILQPMPAQMLALALSTDAGRAQEVKNILLSGSGPSYASYAAGAFTATDSLYSLQFSVQRLTSRAVDQLSAALDGGGIEALLALPRQQLPVNVTQPFDALGPTAGKIALTPSAPLLVPPAAYFGQQVDFTGPFGLYYWELFFHAPLLVAKMLNDNQQFQAAETWLQYIFNPTLPPAPLTKDRFVALRPDDITQQQAQTIYSALTTPPNQLIDPATGTVLPIAATIPVGMLQALLSAVSLAQAQEIKNLLVNQMLVKQTGRYWQFQPFRNHTLESLKDQLTNCAEIAAYNDEPFDPNAIARLRIGAYEKSVVMTYVENLLDWGDSEFSQYSWEAIVTARMLYSYAYDLLGPRPADLGPCEHTVPTTFNIILARYGGDPGDIPQFFIDMENTLPSLVPDGAMLAQVGVPFNDLGGVFTIPENTNLTALWDRVEDRLYKIRNCLNIDGQAQPLPLFQPPIDPMALVRAAAAGNNVLALQAQLHPRVPYFRFFVVVQRASETVETLRSFGSALLSALQGSDAEGMAQLHATNEIAILNMMTLIKNRAIDDLDAQLQSLQDGLQSAQYRQSYYNGLISAGLIAAETSGLTLTSAAMVERVGVVAFNGLSIAGYLAPNIFGLADGGMKFGDAINAGAAVAGALSDILGQSASISQTVGEYQRRAAEWVLQSKLAGYDITSTNDQITATQARIASAQRDLAAHLQQIEYDSKELDFLKSKFTNRDLYRWMIGRLATLYFQAYRMAQELALAAQTAYQFELDRDDQIIAFGYWDNLRQGLLAGEGLALALAQLQQAYLDHADRRMEIEKTVSLRQTFPAAFIGFKWGFAGGDAAKPGRLDFALPEALFDFDFPGHYCRKIKSISLSIPCVVGPYQDLHATLTQNGDVVVMAANIAALTYAAQRISSAPGEPDPAPAGTVREDWVPSQSIAISQGVDDDGMFVLDFKDDRYLPFEGTGAVSSWSFAMPPETNPIDFDGISDVIVKVRYTAKDGGNAFADKVKQYYRQHAADNPRLLSAAFDLGRMFSSEWSQALSTAPVNDAQTITFPVGNAIVLPNLRNAKLSAVLVQLEVAGGVVVNAPVGQEFLSLQIDGKPTTPVPIALVNNFGQIGVDKFPSTYTGVPWSLVFNVGKGAIGPLLTNSALDPNKLLDVALVVVYSADPF
jgi:Tc toxin complex TcA C-terminal TcB-binding domain/Neuraminidase-like domain/Salmonella virulence plasmid 28.1kDa A protein